MQNITIILNHPSIGTEKVYNARRYATALVETGLRVNLFLMGDGVLAAKQGKNLPSGYPNVTDMLTNLMDKGRMFPPALLVAGRGVLFRKTSFLAWKLPTCRTLPG